MGDVSKTHVKWKTEVAGAAGTSSVIVGDYVYRICDQGLIRCWNINTGEVEFEERMQKITPSASPIATADNRIYFASAKRTVVLKAGNAFEVLATNDLETDGGSQDYTTPAVSDGRFYFKGRSYLWCVGTK
jgi:outer membrane protein assembly factor BamB